MRSQEEIQAVLNQVKQNYQNALLHNDRIGRIQDARTLHALSWVLDDTQTMTFVLPEDFNVVLSQAKLSLREEQLAAGAKKK